MEMLLRQERNRARGILGSLQHWLCLVNLKARLKYCIFHLFERNLPVHHLALLCPLYMYIPFHLAVAVIPALTLVRVSSKSQKK